MLLVQVNQIKKSFVDSLLFEDVSFEIRDKDRIGLVGVNGSGKTTLFKMITGLERPDEGAVYKSKEAAVSTMDQALDNSSLSLFDYTLYIFRRLIDIERELDEVSLKIEQNSGDIESLIQRQHALSSQYELMGGFTYRSRTRSTLKGLGFKDEEFGQGINTMSGGQRNKAQLAKVLLSGANLLLLDEPTNHLDIESTQWLEEFLCGYAGAYVVISHDRYFLDKVTNRTLELKNNKLFVTDGNYSAHVNHMSTQNEILLRHYRNTQREIRRIQGIVEQQKRWGQERNFVTAASKMKQIERLRKTLIEPERDEKSVRFRFQVPQGGGNDVLTVSEVAKSYGNKRVFANVSLHIRRGERVFLLGANGCGKTTLLRLIMRKENADAGEAMFGAKVKPGYYDQTMAALEPDNTVLEEMHREYPLMNLTELRTALGAFLFRGDDVLKEVGCLSGGERARVQLLKLMLSETNFLILDEPTNHLDIASREALETALEDYEGTMLVVTHDRYLVNRLADRILYMDSKGITEYIGGYDDCISERSRFEQSRQSSREPEKPNQYKERKEFQSAVNQVKGRLKRCEQEITCAEEELANIERLLSEPENASDYVKAGELARAADKKRIDIERLYEKWAQAQESLEKMEKSFTPSR